MEGIYLLLGSNLGDKQMHLKNAMRLIEGKTGKIERQSSIYETEAWGKTDQPSFYNLVIEISTQLAPEELLKELLAIEHEIGRVRYEKWGARIIDIDILYYDQQVVKKEELIIPHPGIEHRRFTLAPLVEIASDFIHPILKATNRQLLERCDDSLQAKRLDTANLS